jgi:glycosyltransferase 2 family protein
VGERSPEWRWAWLFVRVVVTLSAVAWLVHRIDPARALADMRAAPWWAFCVPVGMLLVNAVIQGRRYQLLLAAGGVDISVLRTTRIVLQAVFVGQVLPRGGADVLRIAWLRRDTGRTDVVLAALLVARLFEVTVLAGLLVYALAWGVADRWPWVGLSALVFALAFGAFAIVALVAGRFGASAVERLPFSFLRRHGASFATALKAIGRDGGRVARAGLLSLPLAGGNVVAAWVVLGAYGLDIPAIDAFALIPAMDSVILLPVTVSGVGLREGVFVYVLSGLGITEATAVAMALTRWCGELGRAAVGGAMFLADGTLRTVGSAPSPGAEPGGDA